MKTVPSLLGSGVAKVINPPNLPYIWSETYEDLLGAVPALVSMNNGISDDGSLSPTILITGSSWPSGSWDGGKEVQLSTTRVFTCAESAEQLPTAVSDGNHTNDVPQLIAYDQPTMFPRSAADLGGDVGVGSHMVTGTASYTPPDCEEEPTSQYVPFQDASERTPAKCPTVAPAISVPPRLGDGSVSQYLMNLDGFAEYSQEAGQVPLVSPSPAIPSFCPSQAPSTLVPPLPAQIVPESGSSSSSGSASRSGSAPVAPDAVHRAQFGGSDVSIPEDFPDDIDRLFKAHNEGMPVTIIMHADWPASPLRLSQECKYAVLGFFHIVGVKMHYESMPQVAKKDGSLRSRGQVTWTFTFRWVPGGEPGLYEPDTYMDIDDGYPSPVYSRPWWVDSRSANADTVNHFEHSGQCHAPCATSKTPVSLLSPKMLDLNILSKHIERDSSVGRLSATSRGWHCLECGMVNPTYWMRCCTCLSCSKDEADGAIMRHLADVIPAPSVRDRLRPTPLWTPVAHIPPNVVRCMKESGNGMRRYTYTYPCASVVPQENQTSQASASNNALDLEHEQGRQPAEEDIIMTDSQTGASASALVVDLFFFGNRAELEGEADSLFLDFQKYVPMTFERTPSKPTAGVFVYNVSPEDESEEDRDGHSSWDLAPPCVKDARKIMVWAACLQANRQVPEESVLHLSAIAWLGESPVKTEIQVKAKEYPVILVCLGADLNVIFTNPGKDQQQTKISKQRTKAQKGQPKTKAGASQISMAGIGDEVWGEKQDPSEIIMEPDHMKITLTHGSILILSGSDVDLTIVRTNFAIRE
ncbi:hypothetical protein M0805_007755 [Coniferiporia weirii]|nr:hypothetical protein M0805_007755 [Coniferiporia weirii]